TRLAGALGSIRAAISVLAAGDCTRRAEDRAARPQCRGTAGVAARAGASAQVDVSVCQSGARSSDMSIDAGSAGVRLATIRTWLALLLIGAYRLARCAVALLGLAHWLG